MASMAAFPDVTDLSFPEFEEVLAKHEEGSKSLLDLLFGDE
jgi:hypothetical protein